MNIIKNLAKKLDAHQGALSGKTIRIGANYQVKVEQLIGQGGFASIYRVTDINTKNVYALKHFMLSEDPDAERDVQMEVAVMKALTGTPSILSLRAASFGTNEAYVLVDLCYGTLAHYINERGSSLGTAEVLSIFYSICEAVQAMHSLDPPLAHRDVKAENILRHPEGRWVLCDFGSASKRHGVLETAVDISREEEVIMKQTTPAYRAPEMWDLYARQPLGPAVDIWSLGCLLYLLCYGKLPFDGDAKLQILNGAFKFPEKGVKRPPMVEALIKEMLAIDPLQRISLKDVFSRLVRVNPSEANRPPSSPPQSQQQQKPQERRTVEVSRVAVVERALPGAQGPLAAGRSSITSPSNTTTTTATGNASVGSEAGAFEGWATFNSPSASPQRPVGTNSNTNTNTTAFDATPVKSGAMRKAPSPVARQPPSAATRTATTRQASTQQTPAAASPARKTSNRVTNSGTSTVGGAPSSRPTSRPTTPIDDLLGGDITTTSSRASSANAAVTGSSPAHCSGASSNNGLRSTSAASGLTRKTSSGDLSSQKSAAVVVVAAKETELRQHGLVLEQLVEEQSREIAQLKNRVKEQDDEIRRLRRAAAQASGLEKEVGALKAEMEVLKKRLASQQTVRGDGGGNKVLPMRSGSGGLTSFPLMDKNDLLTPARGQSVARGGQPMRSETKPDLSNISSAQGFIRSASSAHTSLDFADLNPL